jgi:hypothetical protein
MQDVEEAIVSGTLSALQQRVIVTLGKLTAMDLRGRHLAHLKASSLVLDLIHHRDIAAALAASNTTRASDWQWHQQLRYYMHSEGLFCTKCTAPSSPLCLACYSATSAVPGSKLGAFQVVSWKFLVSRSFT